MANITGSSAAAIGATMTYAARESLPVLKANLGLAKFVRRYTDEVAGVKGSAVVLPAAGSSAAREKSASTAVTFDADEGSEATITLNKHAYKAIRIEDFARAISNPDIFAMYVQSGLVSIAEKVEADAIAAAQAGFTGAVGTYGTDVTLATVRAAGKSIFDNKGGISDRILVLSSKDEMALRADSSLASYFANADPNAIREGVVARIEGFDVLPSQLITINTTPTPDETQNLACRKDALWIATRALPAPDAPGVVVENVTDGDLNFTFRMMVSYDHEHLSHVLTIDALYGVSAVRPTLGVVVKG
jgi:hypothetical protein